MNTKWSDRRITWIGLGVVLGMMLSVYAPQEPAMGAYTAAGGDKISMCVSTSSIGIPDTVFILDETTGRLFGATYAQSGGTFGAVHFRNLAADFRVADDAKYVMVPGAIGSTSTGDGAQTGAGGIFVAESKSGLCILYAFTTSAGKHELAPIGRIPWRKTSRR